MIFFHFLSLLYYDIMEGTHVYSIIMSPFLMVTRKYRFSSHVISMEKLGVFDFIGFHIFQVIIYKTHDFYGF